MDPERWVDAHADALFRYALARLPGRADAEDAVQETLLAALRSQRAFRGDSAERTWLTGILKHKIVDMLRAAARRQPGESLDDSDAEPDLFLTNERWKRPPAKFAIDEQDLVEKEEFWQQFARCMEGLPPRQARVLVLHYLDDSDPESTCKQLEVTTTNLWVLLHRARLRMRACLETNWFHAGDTT